METVARDVIELVSRKWAMLVVYALLDGTKRLSELQREIDGVSQKMLVQSLRDLERRGLVLRTVHPVLPPHVDYALTPLGASLREPLTAMCRWGVDHLQPHLDRHAQ